jgi:hypothetical protein
LGELVRITGADALSVETLAGVLLAALEKSKQTPDVVAGWTERGQAFFQQGGKRKARSATAGNPAAGTPGDGGAAASSHRAAQ